MSNEICSQPLEGSRQRGDADDRPSRRKNTSFRDRDRHPLGPRLPLSRVAAIEKREARGAPASRARSAPSARIRQRHSKSETTVMDGKRALRRAHDRRMKDRARRFMRLRRGRHQWPPDPRKVGVNASTHCRPCGSSLCRDDSRFPPRRERAFAPMCPAFRRGGISE